MGRKFQLVMEVILAMVSAATSTGSPSTSTSDTAQQRMLGIMICAGVAIADDFPAHLPDYDIPGADDEESDQEQQALRTRTMRQVVSFYKAQLARRDWLRESAGAQRYQPGRLTGITAERHMQRETSLWQSEEAALGYHNKKGVPRSPPNPVAA